MNIFVHIGTSKTGTTAIQNVLFNNYEVLKKNGFLYPLSLMSEGKPSRRHLEFTKTFYDKNEKKRFELISNLEIELAESSIQNVIISAEELSGFDASAIESFKETLNLFSSNIKIVCYLRRQDEYIQAFYAQHIKTNSQLTDKIDSYLHRIPNYYELISNWAEIFQKRNIIIQPYEKMQLPDGLMIDFFNKVKIHNSIISKVKVSRQFYNKGTSRTGTELFRLFNKFAINPELKDKLIHKVEKEDTKSFQTAYNLLSEEQLSQINAENGIINKRIAMEFIRDDRKDLFFKQPRVTSIPDEVFLKETQDYLNEFLTILDDQERSQLEKLQVYLSEKVT